MSTKPASPMGTNKSAPVAGAAVAGAAVAGAAAPPVKKPTRVKTVDPNETPEAAFRRLTVPRVENTLKRIKQLRNLSRFKPSAEHREKVFKTLRDALIVAENSWRGGEVASEGFTL
jgi:hypothetical protein